MGDFFNYIDRISKNVDYDYMSIDINDADYFAAALLLQLIAKSTKHNDNKTDEPFVDSTTKYPVDKLIKWFPGAGKVILGYRETPIESKCENYNPVREYAYNIYERIKKRCSYMDLIESEASELDKSVDVASDDVLAAGLIIELKNKSNRTDKDKVTTFLTNQFHLASIIVNNISFKEGNLHDCGSKKKSLGTINNS